LDNKRSWYAFRIFRNGRKTVISKMEDDGYRLYRPEKVTRTYDAEMNEIVTRERLFQNLAFVNADARYIESIRRDMFGVIGFYTDRETNSPIIIPDAEMETCMSVLDAGAERLDVYEGDLKKGSRVRVLGGYFNGAEGYIIRVKGTKRFVVAINGVTAVATSYIPRALLEKLD